MTPPPLIAVAHGSRDPRSAATIAALMDEVRTQRPDLDVRLSFLDLSAPRLPDVLGTVAADGHETAVVVPLLLGHAYHARVDVPGEVHRAARRHPQLDIAVADVLGGDPRLAEAALDRLATVVPVEDPQLGVVLAAIGSSHAPANAAVARIAAGWERRFGWAGARAACATANGPSVAETITALRRDGARRIAVAQWILAPGLLPDRIDRAAAEHDVPAASPLGDHPLVAAVLLDRYADAVALSRRTASHGAGRVAS